MRWLSFLGAAAVVALAVGSAQAQTTDPTDLHVGGTANDAVNAGNDPNIITNNNQFFIYNTSQQNSSDPLDVIFAVPNYGSSTSLPGLPGTATYTTPYPGGTVTNPSITTSLNAYGLTGGPFVGTLTSGENVYGVLDTLSSAFDNANASNSYTNFVGAMDANSISTAGLVDFDLYVVQIGQGLDGKSLADIAGATLENGTFILPFAEVGNGNPDVSAFTTAGLINGPPTHVPEAGSLALLGSALIGFSVFGWFYRRNSPAGSVA